jgi:hypothetical protein
VSCGQTFIGCSRILAGSFPLSSAVERVAPE